MIAHRHVRSLVLALATISLALAGSLVGVRPANAVPHDGSGHDHYGQPESDPIIGTWLTTVTPDGPDAPPPFPQLLTFNEGGTAMQSASGPPIPALGNPGHGVWKRVGRNKVAATFFQFTFDETLQQNGSLKISILVTLNKHTQTITTVDQATIYDLAGNEIVTLTGTEVGKRLHLEVAP